MRKHQRFCDESGLMFTTENTESTESFSSLLCALCVLCGEPE